MSTYWGYRCEDCNADSETWLNHGEEKLGEYVKAYRLFEKQNFQWIDIHIPGESWATGEMEAFLDNHKEHHLVLLSEYRQTKALE